MSDHTLPEAPPCGWGLQHSIELRRVLLYKKGNAGEQPSTLQIGHL
jgi:hypothetical protein